MENEIKQKIAEQDEKLEKIYQSVEKTRKYFLIIMWITVVAVVLPLLGMAYVIPKFMNNYISSFDGLI